MKTDFLSKVSESWSGLEESVAKLSTEQMVAPFEGGWSIKDIMAHVTWYENEMINLIEIHTFSGSDLWELPLQKRNAAIYALIKARDIKTVVNEFNGTHQRLVGLLETLSEEELDDPKSFAGMPLDWKPWQVIASNTYEHYPEHVEQIKAMGI